MSFVCVDGVYNRLVLKISLRRENQQKIQTIVNDLLKLIIQDKSLDDIIQEMQEQAKNRGLTPEILNEILQNG